MCVLFTPYLFHVWYLYGHNCDFVLQWILFFTKYELLLQLCFSRQTGYHPSRTSPKLNTQQTKNETANVVIQPYSRINLKMDILMPETC